MFQTENRRDIDSIDSVRTHIHDLSFSCYRYSNKKWDRRGSVRMVVGFMTICAISAYHH